MTKMSNLGEELRQELVVLRCFVVGDVPVCEAEL